jgi:prepilin-type processing-associated H-X9-DG protein
MSEKDGGTEFLNAVEPILRKVLENIESPFVWMPLGLFILCVLAYPLTSFEPFLYLSIAFLILTFAADWVGRWRNRQPPMPKPIPQESNYRDDLFKFYASVQAKALEMLKSGKPNAALALAEKNLSAVDEALKEFPDDADFHSLRGYILKDMYQSSKNLLSTPQRQAYLDSARASFEYALKLDPDNAGAHNGMGNVLFFDGHFDEAIKEHNVALGLSDGYKTTIEHDKRIVEKVKNGEIPFDF